VSKNRQQPRQIRRFWLRQNDDFAWLRQNDDLKVLFHANMETDVDRSMHLSGMVNELE